MSNFRQKRQTYDVFLGNLPTVFNEKQLTQKFTAYGETLSLRYFTSKKNDKFAIVKYLCEPDALRAVLECDGQEWEGNMLNVKHNKNERRLDWQNKQPKQHENHQSHMKNWNDAKCINNPVTEFFAPFYISDGQNKGIPQDADYLNERSTTKTYEVSNSFNKNKGQPQMVKIEILCTNVQSITTFHGNLCSKLRDVEDIQTNLQHQCATLAMYNAIPNCDEVYATRFSEDQKWYRCAVISNAIPSKPKMCTVKYIDYGNMEDIGYECLAVLPKSMKAIPPLAVRCVLKDVKELDHVKSKGVRFCSELLLEQQVEVFTTMPLNDPISVVKCMCAGSDVMDQIVNKGFAVFTGDPQAHLSVTVSDKPEIPHMDKPIQPKFQSHPHPTNNSGEGYALGHIPNMDKPIQPKFQSHPHPTNNSGEGYTLGHSYSFQPGIRFPSSPTYYAFSNSIATGSIGAPERFDSGKRMPRGNAATPRADTFNVQNYPNASHPKAVKSSAQNLFDENRHKPREYVAHKGKGQPKTSFQNNNNNKVHVLQRNAAVEVSGDGNHVSNLVAENEVLTKKLQEQYNHVKDLRNEMKILQNELENNSTGRKIDAILSSLKLVNHLRDIVSSSTIRNLIDSILNTLKSEQKNLEDYKSKSAEVESLCTLYNKTLQNIKECKDKTKLPELIAEKNENAENLCARLKVCLGHHNSALSNTKDFIQNAINDLQANSSMFVDIPLKKVPSSIDDLISSYQHVRDVKQECVNNIRQTTDEKHEKFMNMLSEFQNKLNLRHTTSSSEQPENDVVDNSEEASSMSLSFKFDEALTQLRDSLSKEISIYALNNEGAGTSIIQLLLAELEAFRKKVDESCSSYEYHESLFKELKSGSVMESSLSEMSGIKNKMKSVKSKLRHKLADKKDLEENEEDSSEALINLEAEISSLQYQLHSLFMEEDNLKKTLVLAYETNNPEIDIEHAELKLSKYSQYHYLLKLSWEPEHFTLKKLPDRLGVEYESKFLSKTVIIKELVLESEEKINDYISAVEQWENIKSEFLVSIRALFLKNERIMYTLIPSLSQSLINYESTFNYRTARLVLQQVLRGLNDLHSNGLAHGALYPHAVLCNEENILLDFCFDVKVKNGLSRLKNLSFQASEQIMTQSSDMYSFGCLILWVLVPNMPSSFMEESSNNFVEVQQSLNKTLTEQEQAVLCSLLNDNPACRPTASELLKNNFLRHIPETPAAKGTTPSDVPLEIHTPLKGNISSESNISPKSNSGNNVPTVIHSKELYDTTATAVLTECMASQEEDMKIDILGNLSALRMPLIGSMSTDDNEVTSSMLWEIVTDPVVADCSPGVSLCHEEVASLPSQVADVATEVIKCEMNTSSASSPGEDSDYDTLTSLNALREALGKGCSLRNGLMPETHEAVSCYEDSHTEEHDAGIAEEMHKGAPVVHDLGLLSPAKGSAICDNVSDLLDSLLAKVVSSPLLKGERMQNDILVTEEELHMLDYVPSDEIEVEVKVFETLSE